jgi:hypothetical protein
MTDIFKCKDGMPEEPGKRDSSLTLNDADVVRSMMTPDDARAQSRAFLFGDYNALGIRHISTNNHRGKHY